MVTPLKFVIDEEKIYMRNKVGVVISMGDIYAI